ncbi:MAG: hypothetical protein K2N05_11375 [Muribaculaceae bacterium]|nr:hypothetical protein [Muribaculaceae bacterium]
MIKRIFLYICAMMSLAACSDDIFNAPMEQVPENGEIPISFTVPEMIRTATRAEGFSEMDFGTVTMLVYSGDKKLIHKDDIENPEEGYTVTIPKPYRKDPGLYFLFFTNDPRNKNSFDDGSDIKKAFDEEKNSVYNEDKTRLVMCGSASLRQLLQAEAVSLFHNAAKISVHSFVAENAPAGTVPASYFPFEVYGLATKGKLMAGTYNGNESAKKNELIGNPSNITLAAFGNDQNLGKELYVFPTKNTGDNYLNKSYIIVKAQVGDKWYYYCLRFMDETGKLLDILPNHFYDVNIKTNNIKEGYSTPQEAAKNPIPLENDMYVIYDHSPQIANLISDGTHTLGVPHALVHENAAGMEYLYVKLISGKSATEAQKEYDDFYNNYTTKITFPQTSFVTLGAIDVAKSTDEDAAAIFGTVGNGQTGEGSNAVKDGDTEGIIYKIEVNFRGNSPGNQSGMGTVTWEGLSRNFKIEWKRVFDTSALYKTVSASISGGSYTTNFFSGENYFEYIAGKKDENGQYLANKAPKIWGMDADANNGEARDNGFHFPMNYGGNAKCEYTVELMPLITGSDYTYTAALEGDSFITEGVEVTILDDKDGDAYKVSSGKGPRFELKLKDSYLGSYTYAVGKLVLTVDNHPFDIPLYHTGFFHQDRTTNLAKDYQPSTDRAWTYYEVITDGNGVRWLDRNVGAHSAQMYVEGPDDEPYSGPQAAAGGYYRVADYNRSSSDAVAKDPKMREYVCPPGFTYPTQNDFDRMIKLTGFSMEQTGNYHTARLAANKYYKLEADEEGGQEIKYVYFPKARYLDKNNKKTGEARSGYYWTQTPATGFEKDEVGSWLYSWFITGSTSSYINGEVNSTGTSKPSNANNGYAMPVRCILSSDVSDKTVERTSLLVKGATHVFLYTLDGGKKNALTTWPGYALCTANTAGNVYNLSYQSSINTPGTLYAIFNYKDADGKIHTASRNLSDETTLLYSSNLGVDDLNGFKIEGGTAPDAEKYSKATAATSNGARWTFDFTSNPGSVKGGIGEVIGGGGDTETFTYRVNGKIFTNSWDGVGSTQELIKKSGSNIWEAEITASYTGPFLIQQMKSDGTVNAYYKGGVNVSDGGTWPASTDKDDFTINQGKYKFSFDATTMKLTVTKVVVTQTVSFALRIPVCSTEKTDKDGMKLYLNTTATNGSGGASWPGQSMTKTADGKYYYYKSDITIESGKTPADFMDKYKVVDSSNNGTTSNDVTWSSNKHTGAITDATAKAACGNPDYLYTIWAVSSSEPTPSLGNKYGDFPTNSKFYIHGSLKGSDWSPYQMNDDDNDGIWEVTVETTQDSWDFGIRRDDENSSTQNEWINGTSSNISFGSPMEVKRSGSGSNWKGYGKSKVKFLFCPKDKTVTVVPEIYVIGNLNSNNNWDTRHKMDYDANSKKYTATVTLYQSGYFRFVRNTSEWKAFGSASDPTDVSKGNSYSIKSDTENNFRTNSAGTYYIELDFANNMMYISNPASARRKPTATQKASERRR